MSDLARAGNIKLSLYTSEELARLPIAARWLFVGLCMMADREGRLEDCPQRIKMTSFPADELDVGPLLAGLAEAGLIVRFQAEGNACIWIPGYAQPQSSRHKPPETDPDEFLEFKSVYPQRAGSQRWRDALHACKARLKEGSTWSEILAGARRYAAFIEATGKADTEYVMQAKTFVGPEKHFRDPWRPPKRELSPIERILNRGRTKADERQVN